MHDVVAHSLSVMIALSDGAAVVIKRDPHRAGEVLRRAFRHRPRRAGGHAPRDRRAARAGQRRAAAAAAGGGSLEEMLEGFRVAGRAAEVRAAPARRCPRTPTFQLTVYRIIQEA